jgi:hypothetical protein
VASFVQDMGLNHHHIELDSVPVGVSQMASAPENLCSWLKTSGYNRCC